MKEILERIIELLDNADGIRQWDLMHDYDGDCRAVVTMDDGRTITLTVEGDE